MATTATQAPSAHDSRAFTGEVERVARLLCVVTAGSDYTIWLLEAMKHQTSTL
jgi:hypothetical protein